MLLLQKKGKNSYVVRLHRNFYKQEALNNILKEDREWVRRIPSKDAAYYHCRLNTSCRQDVLEWLNYLFYLSKTS